mgnify:CR=1 FL=1
MSEELYVLYYFCPHCGCNWFDQVIGIPVGPCEENTCKNCRAVPTPYERCETVPTDVEPDYEETQ